MKKLLVLPIFAICLVLAGCPNTPYGKAADTGLKITDSMHTAADVTDQLRVNGTLTAADEKQVLAVVGEINRLDVDVYGPCVKAAHAAGSTSGGFSVCAKQFADKINDPAFLANLHITNPASQARAREITVATNNLLQLVLTTFSQFSAKGK